MYLVGSFFFTVADRPTLAQGGALAGPKQRPFRAVRAIDPRPCALRAELQGKSG
jgi:hypothetical protein